MNKTYLAIIGVLLVIALAVGGYAVYKTVNQDQAQAIPNLPPPPPVAQTPPPPPAATPSAQNTLPLTVSAPKDGDSFSKATINVTGKTAPKADVSVNDKELVADATGTFSTTLVLDEGDNPILIVASDEKGNSAEKEITVSYTPAQ